MLHCNMVENNKNYEMDPRKDRLSGRAKKSVFAWSGQDVLRWLQKYHPLYYSLYGENFRDNDIIGKVLVHLTTLQLAQMGISNEQHRDAIMERIIKLKLRHEQVELKLLRKTPQTPKGS